MPVRRPSSSWPVASIGSLDSPRARTNTLVEPAGTMPSAGTPRVDAVGQQAVDDLVDRAVAAQGHHGVDAAAHRPAGEGRGVPAVLGLERPRARTGRPAHGPGRRAHGGSSPWRAGSPRRGRARRAAYVPAAANRRTARRYRGGVSEPGAADGGTPIPRPLLVACTIVGLESARVAGGGRPAGGEDRRRQPRVGRPGPAGRGLRRAGRRGAGPVRARAAAAAAGGPHPGGGAAGAGRSGRPTAWPSRPAASVTAARSSSRRWPRSTCCSPRRCGRCSTASRRADLRSASDGGGAAPSPARARRGSRAAA